MLVLAFAVVSGPVWEWNYSLSGNRITWSYGVFGATNTTSSNGNNTTTASYPYSNLPGQPRMAATFLSFQMWLLLGIVAAVAGLGLSAATAAKKLRGLPAGIALLLACASVLYAALNLVLAIPNAAGDLPAVGGNAILNFQGTLQSQSGTVVLSYGPELSWYLVLGMALALGFGASDMWGLRVPKKAAATQRVESAPIRGIPPPPPDEPVATPAEPSIEEVFVIAANGLLVKHMSRSLMSDKDRDVVGGMISVVSNFVRDAFSERDAGQVQEVTLGDHRFIIANDRGLVVAALVTQGDMEDITHRLFHLLACLHDRYDSALRDWSGGPLPGIEDEIAVLWQPFFVPPPPAE